jgi:hypothetical protein
MRRNWTLSFVPESGDQSIYMVFDKLGRLGAIWPAADAEATEHTGEDDRTIQVTIRNIVRRGARGIDAGIRHSMALAYLTGKEANICGGGAVSGPAMSVSARSP